MEYPDLLTNLKILVVEDSEELTVVWRALFRRRRVAARFCNAGKSALSMIDTGEVPDVVMTDYYLPDINGLDLVCEMKKRSQAIKFLMVTGNRDETFIGALEKENIAMIFKPVRFPELLKKLEELVQGAPFAFGKMKSQSAEKRDLLSS